MKLQTLEDKYPIYSIGINKKECLHQDIKEIVNFLISKINNHSIAQFISTFDHFSHTKKITDGTLSDEILDAQLIMFCFGKKLDNPLQLATRPRSIGIAEMSNEFTISFLSSPSPVFNEVMQSWITALQK